jgi:hypothetical protein
VYAFAWASSRRDTTLAWRTAALMRAETFPALDELLHPVTDDEYRQAARDKGLNPPE